MKYVYNIYGYVTIDIAVQIGSFETDLRLRECWDFIYKIFCDEAIYKEGIFAREVK